MVCQTGGSQAFLLARRIMLTSATCPVFVVDAPIRHVLLQIVRAGPVQRYGSVASEARKISHIELPFDIVYKAH